MFILLDEVALATPDIEVLAIYQPTMNCGWREDNICVVAAIMFQPRQSFRVQSEERGYYE